MARRFCVYGLPKNENKIMNKVLLNKYAGKYLRDNNVDFNQLIDYEPTEKEWKELRSKKAILSKTCRRLTDTVNKESRENDVSDIEDVFDDLMSLTESISDEMDQRDALGCRDPRPNAKKIDLSKRPILDEEQQKQEWDTDKREESNLILPEERMSKRTSSQSSGVSLGSFFRSMVVGAHTEQEKRALSEGSDSGGGYSVPEILSAELIDLMRAKSVAIQAGARTAKLTSDLQHIAKVASDPVPAWRAENGSVNESDPTFTRVTFAPKSLAVLVKASRELLEDSLNIREKLPEILAASLAKELDRVVFMGTGTGNEPTGLDSLSGVTAIAVDAPLASYAPLLSARKALMGVNTDMVTAYVMHSDTESAFGSLVDLQGQPLQHPSILDRPEPMRMLTTTQIPTDLGAGTNETTVYAGDFRQLVIGVRSDIRIEILKERFADNMQYGFIAHLRADVAAVHPNAFVRLTGVQL